MPRRRPDAATGRTAWHTGRAAELVAERLYAREGGRVIARRWRCPEGEIDLAVQLGATLVFVEVKARPDAAHAAEALRPAQAARLVAAASRFLGETGGEREARFDVVLVDRLGRAERVENALVQH